MTGASSYSVIALGAVAVVEERTALLDVGVRCVYPPGSAATLS
jgi:hypothetical protein